ncbi:MAG: dihydrodipicolinate synthase family protein [Promethearchaeota archaeon]
MINSNINGVIVPSITFFNQKFEINRKLNSLLFKHIILNGANAIFLFGITGEGLLFSNKLEEKTKLIYDAKKIVKDKIPILIGMFGINREEIIVQINELGKIFDSLCFVIAPPTSKKLSQEELKNYFKTIIESINSSNHIYLYNHPNIFGGNIIEPEIIKELISFPHLKGIKNASDNIKLFKSYIQFINENFSVFCEKERRFSTFLELVPLNLRNYCGIVPSISNLLNLPVRLYNFALDGNTVEMMKLQEELNDFRNKIYDSQEKKGKKQRGLKFAFYSLYKEYLKSSFSEVLTVSSEIQRILGENVQNRINAIINYLINLEYIDKFYHIGENIYNFDEFKKKLDQIATIKKSGTLKKIKGPYSSKINAIYRMKFENEELIFRARILPKFIKENIVKEKVLFPFLDSSLYVGMPKLREKIKQILSTQSGSYIFDKDKPSIIPVGNLVYYDETQKIFPYIYTIQEYIPGKPLHLILEKYRLKEQNITSQKFLTLFNELGVNLAKLHRIQFETFYKCILDIGKNELTQWQEIFKNELIENLQEAKKYKLELINDLTNYFKENFSLIEDEFEPILFHNDYHAQNIIIKENLSGFRMNGLVNFDNWRIGVRAQDFVKMLHLTLKPLNEPILKKSFYQGYSKQSKKNINKDFEKKIEIYSLIWFLKAFNFEKGEISKFKQKTSVDMKILSLEDYINEMKKILFT